MHVAFANAQVKTHFPRSHRSLEFAFHARSLLSLLVAVDKKKGNESVSLAQIDLIDFEHNTCFYESAKKKKKLTRARFFFPLVHDDDRYYRPNEATMAQL